MGPQPPRSRRAASLHGVPSRLEDDRHRPDAARDLDARARDRAACGPPLRVHRQRARRERRLDLVPGVRQGTDPARLVRHRRLRAHRRGCVPPLRRAHPRALPEVRKTVRPAPDTGPPPRKSVLLKAGSKRWLAALCTSRVLAATWFVAYSAVLPLTQAEWGLSAKEAGLIQSAFHLGYLASLFIVGFIADHYGAKRAYITTGIAACISPWAFVLFADGFWSAFWLHALTGLCQGGTYTPALSLINDNVGRDRRGRAMGFLIAGSSAGYAICLGIASLALRFTGWRGALVAVAC